VLLPMDPQLVGVLPTPDQGRGLKIPDHPGLVGLDAVEPDLGIGWDPQLNTDRTVLGDFGGRCTVIILVAQRTVIARAWWHPVPVRGIGVRGVAAEGRRAGTAIVATTGAYH